MISYNLFNIISYYVQFVNMFIVLHMVDNRYLHTLKSYVRNKTYLEGFITKRYLAENHTTSYSRYLNDVKTKYNHTDRNFVGLTKGFIIFKYIKRVLKRFACRELSSKE